MTAASDPTAPPPGATRLPFHVLAKPTGAACNLDCTYCFFLSKELLYDHDGQRMSEEGLEKYLRNYLYSQPDGRVEVAWQGGEPTMRGLAFYERAVELVERLRRPSQYVEYAMQTNGTLLDDDWGRFFARNNVLVGLSMDGPAAHHDAYRVNKAGRGSHAQVLRGLEVLRRHQVETNILCTVHAGNQDHPLEVYRYFRDELGVRHMQFIPIVERVAADNLAIAEQGWGDQHGARLLYRQEGNAVTSRSVTPAAWGSFLSAIFDEWIARDVGSVFVQHFDVLIGNRVGRYSLCVHSPECGAALAVEHNGDIYSCDHYVEPDYLLGNVATDLLMDVLASPRQREFGQAKREALPNQCLECPVRWACHGGCPKDRFARTAEGQGGLNYLCEGYYRFFSHASDGVDRIVAALSAGRPAASVMAPHPTTEPGI